MPSNLLSLKNVYYSLGGKQTDRYSDIASNAPFRQYTLLADVISAIGKLTDGARPLPAVTSADNGKKLTVSGGEWSAVNDALVVHNFNATAYGNKGEDTTTVIFGGAGNPLDMITDIKNGKQIAAALYDGAASAYLNMYDMFPVAYFKANLSNISNDRAAMAFGKTVINEDGDGTTTYRLYYDFNIGEWYLKGVNSDGTAVDFDGIFRV